MLAKALDPKVWFRALRGARRTGDDEQPLRAELFSADQMEQHGALLARSHEVSAAKRHDRLLARLADNRVVLTNACSLLAEALKKDHRIAPAGEWLLDNFYLIEEQIRTARMHLPKGYSWELPRLRSGQSSGLPRVYDIALETISHGDGRVDGESLGRFVAAYQKVTPLKLGELWAIPIMLRLALIENLRRVAARIASDRAHCDLANRWADQMTHVAQHDPKNLILVISDMARSSPPSASAFVAELARRLQGQGPALNSPLIWVQQFLLESGLSIEQLVHAENQQQAADQVSISNSIGSLRFLTIMDWREFVEAMSLTEQTLRRDPHGTYARMDFATRDHYRHVVEAVAKSTALPEQNVAARAIELAQDCATREGEHARSAHVGFYLIDDGMPELVRGTPTRRSLRALPEWLRLTIYLGAIVLPSICVVAALAYCAHARGVHGALLALTVVCVLLCIVQLGVVMTNRLVIAVVAPRVLARMDFTHGIPAEYRSLVIVPTMLGDVAAVHGLIEALEVRFLANRDSHLHFGLLTDFTDAPSKVRPNDGLLMRTAAQGIAGLNEKYADKKEDIFFLLHRPRRWNPREHVWMGYERKRGKLGDLNALLRGGANESFSSIVGRTEILSSVKFVITLDTDTQLPRDTATQMIATMAHPLNRACYNQALQRVDAGYGILQPRVAVSLTSANRSWYAHVHAGEAGIDPYTNAVSDVYQDLFGEGSFIGKGIYDVDALEHSLAGRFPDNCVLSHDLLEGCYARSGLLSDVQIYEDYPASYDADVRRRHRWIRGDWQIARWLLPRVPGANGILSNPTSALSRWKIADNLRRSLTPTALTLLFALGWVCLPHPGWWTLIALATVFLPVIGASLIEFFQPVEDAQLLLHLRVSLQSVGRRALQTGFVLACLPHEMLYTLDAVLRTCVRLLLTHRRLLEWYPSDLVRNRNGDLAAEIRTMWLCPALAIGLFVFLLAARPHALTFAAPILSLWLLGPLIARQISRPRERPAAALAADQKTFLRHTARRTWGFFETFVGAKPDHWLPPDNVQEQPTAAVAHRTSPTNIGLSLLANLAAYDFGYLNMVQLVERTRNAFESMQALDRHRGHFYNWYDTESLQPLSPRYISTVDSGNLSAHLLTLRVGLFELPDRSVVATRIFEGLVDTFDLAVQESGASPFDALAQFGETLRELLSNRPVILREMRGAIAGLAVRCSSIRDAAAGTDAPRWMQALVDQCAAAREDLDDLFPWLAVAAPAGADALLGALAVPTLRNTPQAMQTLLDEVSAHIAGANAAADRSWHAEFLRHADQSIRRANARMQSIAHLARQCGELAQMDFAFLYDHDRHLFTIGYNVSDGRQDMGYYDMLASEARLANFVAIAQGQVPQESWFALGRPLTITAGEVVLLSWGGSMFEYLMPLLVMPTYENTLLDRTNKIAVQRQIDYGNQRGVPWGISESGYNSVDAALNYQYRTFGVPALGLKRGLGEDLVIAPYASALALMVAPEQACSNLQRLHALGIGGKFGFHEAVDYTTLRLRRGQPFAVVQSFMAHHQGMSLLALGSVLLDRPMQRRFASDPLFQATMDLLQEKAPRVSNWHFRDPHLVDARVIDESPQLPVRTFHHANTSAPAVQLLSNGRYHAMVGNAGGGYSRWKDLAITRWREDSTCDHWGTFCYVRDVQAEKFWSNAFQPTCVQPDSYEANFSESRIEFRRRDGELDTHTDIAVSPEDDIELRRISIVNRARTRKTVDVVSYAEVVLAPAIADELHRVFSNLFVQTEIIRSRNAILCTRRPRSSQEQPLWMFHLLVAHGADSERTSFETDRARFIGRRRSAADPQALHNTERLSDTAGAVLDPIVAVQHRIALGAGESVTLDMVTGVGESRAACLALVEKYQDRRLADRVFDLAWTHSLVSLRQINVTEADAQLFGRLAGRVIFANDALRAEPSLIASNRRGQSSLWAYAISGDLPIVLIQIRDPANIELVRQLVQAHAYWRMKGLAVDLIIWNDDHGGYRQVLHDQIMGLIASGIEANVIERPGGVFVRLAEQVAPEDRILIQAVARAIFSDSRGTLAEQIKHSQPPEPSIPRLVPTRNRHPDDASMALSPPTDLLLHNGFGGFAADGSEYVITTAPEQPTPAPWVNVLANANFGTVISESGGAYTWSENAHEYRLTPWHNDPVGDSSGEAFYLRDEDTGRYWSPTPLPAAGTGAYATRHGFGYSVFEHSEDGISTELWVYVALDAAVKFSVLKVKNTSLRTRKLSATGYVEWVLGDLRTKSAMHIVTEIDPASGALFARNGFNPDFTDRVAFFDVDDAMRTLSGDRTEFIGRNGTLQYPAAMARTRLSGKTGAALDPCAAIQIPFELRAGQSRELIFRLGVGRGIEDTGAAVRQLRKSGAARTALDAVRNYWRRALGVVQVRTPQPALDVMANGWLLYQTIACRIWGRSGYYQSGGAFGYRDQLQDAMALVHAEPQLLREQLVRCAARQFRQGDVQHWWHPPSGRGVRTHCSDDYLWLPLATARYVSCTGDRSVLSERADFLEGRLLGPAEESYYDLPSVSGESADLYEHCVRAIRHGLRFGAHGLPLIGSGDWNDGMNNVGIGGEGESVWLGFFLFYVLTRFGEIASLRNDAAFAELCRNHAEQLRKAIEMHAWDGQWYRRAYFDDGMPLGSSINPECRIDSIAQSWSVLSGAGDPQRRQTAMDSMARLLVLPEPALLQLLAPPFDRSALDPGYIKGYLPGVRENGGQYTHAAIWAVMAQLALGDADRAWQWLQMINPVIRSASASSAALYMVEPYVVASDVYTAAPHIGRGGWTWYTGSAGWLYSAIVESMLGIALHDGALQLDPRLPSAWAGCKMTYRHGETFYDINVERVPHAAARRLRLDGVDQPDSIVVLIDDHARHAVDVFVGDAA